MDTCPDTFIGPICDYEIAMLGGSPSLADRVTNAHNQHTPFGKWLLELLRHSLIDRTPQSNNHGMFMFEENAKDFFFEWGVEAAYHNFVGLANVPSPSQSTLGNLRS